MSGRKSEKNSNECPLGVTPDDHRMDSTLMELASRRWSIQTKGSVEVKVARPSSQRRRSTTIGHSTVRKTATKAKRKRHQDRVSCRASPGSASVFRKNLCVTLSFPRGRSKTLEEVGNVHNWGEDWGLAPKTWGHHGIPEGMQCSLGSDALIVSVGIGGASYAIHLLGR